MQGSNSKTKMHGCDIETNIKACDRLAEVTFKAISTVSS